MDKKLKQAGLRSLAKTASETTETAINNEADKIIASLLNETDYDQIAEQIELLDIIAYRVFEKAVDAIRELLERLENLELTYQDVMGYSAERIKKYHNNYTLMVKALELLEHIRYHQPAEILDIFFDYSCHEEESVAKQAKHGIEELAEYDLDIFYGDGKDWPGLGWEPQEKILEKISSFDEEIKNKYFNAIMIACEKILSPSITGTSSTYNAVTWRTGAIPANIGVREIRKKALEVLMALYALAKDIKHKKAVLTAIKTATHTPHRGEYGDDLLEMVIENSISVIEFMKSIAISDDMQIMQKVEHDAYWLLYHKGSLDEKVRKGALEIRDSLYANEEYQKFRILIGFESIFHDWEKDGKERDDFDREKELRETEAIKLAESISADSYDDWKERIIRYASIESNDLATFPYFGKFLEHFGKTSPALALQLVSESADQIKNFIIAILCGVTQTENKKDVYSLLEDWCNEGKYLFTLARFFEFTSELNEELVTKIFNKAVESNDLNTLRQIISSVSAQYAEDNKHLIHTVFIPALNILTANKVSDWIFDFWFRKQRSNIISHMEADEHKAILDNLFWLREIDYHAEEILCAIAEHSPELVIEFFCERLSKEKDANDEDRYEAVPFSFHKLSEPLSKHPEKAVDAVLNTYDGNYGLFAFRGARLLKNIFPDFPPDFQHKLIEVIQSKEENDLLFVMAILRNYDGNPIIHDTCRELVKILPSKDKLTNEIDIILRSTGVVSGEYGIANAYKQKIDEIQPWLHDEDQKVKEFTQNYIEHLEKSVEYEIKRADEEITLRKHQYGSGEE